VSRLCACGVLGAGASRRLWAYRAKVEALVGSGPKSIPSAKSGIRCFQAFAQEVLGKPVGKSFPPSADDLVAWSALFRCSRTYTNYLGYARLGCMLVGAPTSAFDDDAVKRAKRAVDKRRRFVPRARRFIQLELVQRILEACYIGSDSGVRHRVGSGCCTQAAHKSGRRLRRCQKSWPCCF